MSRLLIRFLSLAAAVAAIGGVCAVASSNDDPFPLQAAASGKSQQRLSPAASVPAPFGQNAADYRLTFSEEFDRLDRSVWNDHIWYEDSNPARNYAAEGGMLRIWPQRGANNEFFNRTLDTDGRFEQLYGYFEMEAKLPRGRGVWPAFWLMAHPQERRPEIDIMEAYPAGEGWGFMDKAGMFRPNVYGTTVWFDKDKMASLNKHQAGTDLSAGFHRYAVKWEPTRHTFFFDGKPVHTVEGVVMHDPMYILLDLWFGEAAGTPDDTTPQGKSNAFEVKYVRAWQFRHGAVEPQKKRAPLPPLPAPGTN